MRRSTQQAQDEHDCLFHWLASDSIVFLNLLVQYQTFSQVWGKY